MIQEKFRGTCLIKASKQELRHAYISGEYASYGIYFPDKTDKEFIKMAIINH